MAEIYFVAEAAWYGGVVEVAKRQFSNGGFDGFFDHARRIEALPRFHQSLSHASENIRGESGEVSSKDVKRPRSPRRRCCT
jgi:hypothetical protein